jgi:hypothetical protein
MVLGLQDPDPSLFCTDPDPDPSINPCQDGPIGALMQNGQNFECPCSAFSPADPKIVSERAGYSVPLAPPQRTCPWGEGVT